MWTLLVACALILLVFCWNPGDREIGHSDKAPGSGPETGSSLQEPVEGSSDGTMRRTFSVRFVPLFLMVVTTVVLGAFTVIKLGEGDDFHWMAFAAMTAFVGIPLSAFGTLIIRRTGQLTVHESGLHDCAALMGGVFVEWKDMEVAESRFLLIWRALRIRSRSSGKR